MKKTKRLATIVAFSLAALALMFAGCKDDDDDSNTSSGLTAEEQAENNENYAFNILRALSDLTTDDEDIETLPENWKSLTNLTADIGVPSPTDAKVRLVSVNGVDDAREYVSDIIGEEVEGDSAIWNISGLGTLNFSTATSEADIFATLTVKINQIPNLSQIQFVDAEYYATQAAENSYKGLAYYHAGDVIKRNKDSTYWMCVRPAGGPLYKDKSYWICLNPESLIKTEVKKNLLCYYIKDDVAYDFKNTWVFAKNLMTLKTAKAAYHTLALLNAAQVYTDFQYRLPHRYSEIEYDPEISARKLKEDGITLGGIYAQSCPNKESFDATQFFIAYGSSKTDSNRKLSNKESPTGKNACVSVVQPFISGRIVKTDEEKMLNEKIDTYWQQTAINSAYKNKRILLSATDTFDDFFEKFTTSSTAQSYGIKTMDLRGAIENFIGSDSNSITIEDTSQYYEAFDDKKWLYDFRNFLHTCDANATNLAYKKPFKTYALWEPAVISNHVLFSPELVLNDNEGTADTKKRPKSVSAYEDICVVGDGAFDWWGSLTYTTRTVDGKAVDWKNENN